MCWFTLLHEWDTCAVVGSSPAILGSGLGRRIDLHDAIFRVNAAVTSRRFRGSVTDLRADVRGQPLNGACLGIVAAARALALQRAALHLLPTCRTGE